MDAEIRVASRFFSIDVVARTTLDLPDPLFRQMQTDLENGHSSRERGETEQRVKAPILPSKQPGVLNLTNAEIDQLLA